MRQKAESIWNRMTEIQKNMLAVYLCALVPVILYLVCLILTSDSYPELNSQGPVQYVLRTVFFAACGWLLGWLIRKIDRRAEVRRTVGGKGVLSRIRCCETAEEEEYPEEDWSYAALKQSEILGRRRRLRQTGRLTVSILIWLVLWGAFFALQNGSANVAWWVRRAVCCLWPVLMVLLFEAIWELWDTFVDWYVFGLTEACKTALYFAAVGLLIWVAQDGLVVYVTMEWEPVQTVYLLFLAAAVLVICRGKLRSRLNRIGIALTGAAAAVISLFLFFRDHYRVREILYNLGFEAAKGEYFFDNENWLDYHMRALAGNLQRDVSELSGLFVHSFSYTNPLAFINLAGGPVLVLLILVWLVLWIRSVRRLARSLKDRYLNRVMLLSVAFAFGTRTVIGLAMDALLVTSASVTVPLLGYSMDVMLLAALPALAGSGRSAGK